MTGTREEVVFELSDSDFFLSRVSAATDCTIRLEDIFPRSDGSVLEFVSVDGADPAAVQSAIEAESGTTDVRRISSTDDEGLFAIVSETPTATTLADNESISTSVVAEAGTGRLRAEIPAHVDTSAVIEAFCSQYPKTRLVRRSSIEHDSPTITAEQHRERILSSLTERQLEVLRMAYATGYFEWPRDVSTEDLAEHLDVNSSTTSQHLRLAIEGVLSELFDPES